MQTKPTKRNLPSKIYQAKPTKPTKPISPNQTYQTKHTNQTYQIKHEKPTKPNMDLYLLSAVFVTIGFAMSGVIVCDVKEVARLEDKLQDFSNC